MQMFQVKSHGQVTSVRLIFRGKVMKFTFLLMTAQWLQLRFIKRFVEVIARIDAGATSSNCPPFARAGKRG